MEAVGGVEPGVLVLYGAEVDSVSPELTGLGKVPQPDPCNTPHEVVEEFARLLAGCQRKVFLYVLALIHNPADAEEVLQETNLVLWRKFDQYTPGTDFARWACRVAYFEVQKYRRRKARGAALLSDAMVETLAAEAEQQTDLVDRRRSALRKCLQKLPDKWRRLVVWRYQPRATTRAVAEAAGRSVEATRRALHRIRMNLLECIRRTLAAEEQV